MFSKKIQFIHKKENKIIFKIENFLEQNLYNEIEKNFPVIDHERIILKESFGKKFIEHNNVLLKNIKQKNCFANLDKIILSKYFFQFFTSKFHKIIALSQDNILRSIKYLRPPINFNDNKRINYFNSQLRVAYDFSIIKNKGGIVPHVDGQRKYLSLMLYFPDNKYNDLNYGTTFWACKKKNFSNKHIENSDEIISFRKKEQVLYRTPFTKNCLYGFIRNNVSWHSVEPIDVNDKYLRRSVNINFFYEN